MKSQNGILLAAAFALALTLPTSSYSQRLPATLQVWLEPACPSVAPPLTQQAGFGALLVEGLVGTLLTSVVDAAGSYFTAAAKTKSVALKGGVDDVFYGMTPSGELSLNRDGRGCLVLMVPGTQTIQPWFAAARQRSTVLNNFDRLPQFYFEAAYERASGKPNTLLLRNQFMHVGAFFETGWAYRDDRNYSVALTLRRLDDGQPFGQASFTFEVMRPGTWGVTQITRNNADGTSTVDTSIQPTLLPQTTLQSVPFFPSTGDIDVAVSTQKLVAAPYVRAAALVNQSPRAPVLNEPEWRVRAAVAGTVSDPLVDRLTKGLMIYCDSLDKLKGGKSEVASDARCPVAHLQAANELADAHAALKVKMEREWADAFVIFNSTACKNNKDMKMECTPPKPKQFEQGPFTWEAVVVETREPTAFATAVASAFAANKEKLKTELQDELIPSRKAAIREKAEEAARGAMVDFRVAMLRVDQAEAQLLEAASKPRSEQIDLQTAVLRAKVAANTAARAASQPVPFDL